jgi:transposase
MKSYSFFDFLEEFPNDDVCLQRLFIEQHGSDSFTCPNCGVVDSKFYKLKDRKCYSCVNCRFQLHPTAGTIFHKSETPLTKWFFALYLFSVSKNGVSAKELERQLRVTYKCAYRIGKQIRTLMAQNSDKLSGVIEIDETYIGGRRKLSSRYDNKTTVVGMTERKGKAVAHVGYADASTAVPMLDTYAEKGSIIYSDDSRIYHRVKRFYEHDRVNHSAKQYVKGLVHTNSIEGFWSQLKRSLDGTYHAVSPQQLQRYVDQFVFSYNHRDVQTYPILLERASRQG